MSGAFLLTRSGSMLKLSLVDKSGAEQPCGVGLLPVSWFLSAISVGFQRTRAVPKLLPDAKSIPKREEASLLGVLA